MQLPPKPKVLGWGQTRQIINMVSVRIPCAALVTPNPKRMAQITEGLGTGRIRMAISYQDTEKSF